MVVRRRLRISGTVQGVGFRPFVRRLADDLGLAGAVGNDDDGVWCEVQGRPVDVDAFIDRLRSEAPPLARIGPVGVDDRPVESGTRGFAIAISGGGGGSGAGSLGVVPPDVAPCAACRAELADPADRRHRYPFTCCVDCGPRYTVIRALPYDRVRTSMAPFELCPTCAAEYDDPADRRHHAQATCCVDCGPRLTLTDPAGRPLGGDPIAEAAALLSAGRILALKGVGGYQLVCVAGGPEGNAAVARLRSRKHREEKPFALLVGSVVTAGALIEVGQLTERALTGPEAPIVLAPRIADAPVAEAVAPGTRLLGVMLPASPLHILLAEAVDRPLVCTSGNRSEEPIVIEDGEVSSRLGSIADAVLIHDRSIERRADDSVGRVVAGDFQVLRRARGFAPRPVRLATSGPPLLAVGAELKNTVGLAIGSEAHLSVHLGDLENPAALGGFEEAVADLLDLAGVAPQLVVHDLHPGYLSTKFAAAADLAPTLAVQHHHAHLASCLVDNGHPGPAIGMTFDGLGLGDDGTLWGGEVLVGDAGGCQRMAHLRSVPQPGGGAAVTEPWRMAVAHLVEAVGPDVGRWPDLAMLDRHRGGVPAVVDQVRWPGGLLTSSMGRLFDAVAALCELGDRISHEGQAAIALEQAAEPGERSTYPVVLGDGEPLVIDPRPMVAAVIDDLLAAEGVPAVAGRFHRWVADVVIETARRVRDRGGPATVALSGGVFQNLLLAELVVPGLVGADFEVLHHRQVPPNDGGIALGQLAIGRAQLARGGLPLVP